ncbi:hypothetical protein D9M72_157740 [compost metagenome]
MRGERVEQQPLQCLGQSGAVVAHAHRDAAAGGTAGRIVVERGIDRDLPARGRISGGVVQQVAENLRQPHQVAAHRQRLLGQRQAQRVAVGVDLRPHRFDRGIERGAQLYQVLAQRDAALVEARDIEQLVDQPGQVVQLAPDDVARAEHVLARGRQLLQHVGGTAQRCERVAQLVGEHGQELVLALLLVAQRASRAVLQRHVLADAGNAQRPGIGGIGGIGDIGGIAGIGARGRLIRAVHGKSARADLAQLAVRPRHPEFDVHAAVIQHAGESGLDAGAVGRDQAVQAAARVFHHVCCRMAPQRLERRADEQQPPGGGIEDPDHVGQRLRQLAEQVFVVVQRLRGAAVGIFRAAQPQQRLDARQDFLRLGRLDQVAVGAAVQRFDPLARLGHAGRGQQHQGARDLRVILDQPAHFQPTDIGQARRQQHQRRRMLAHQRQRRLASGRLDHRELAAMQDAALDVARPLAVLDIEDQGGAVGLRTHGVTLTRACAHVRRRSRPRRRAAGLGTGLGAGKSAPAPCPRVQILQGRATSRL